MKVIFRTLILGTLACGGIALAQESAKPAFDALDKNGDGRISVAEAADDDRLFVAFKALDTDKDGELTREEYAKYQ